MLQARDSYRPRNRRVARRHTDDQEPLADNSEYILPVHGCRLDERERIFRSYTLGLRAVLFWSAGGEYSVLVAGTISFLSFLSGRSGTDAGLFSMSMISDRRDN